MKLALILMCLVVLFAAGCRNEADVKVTERTEVVVAAHFAEDGTVIEDSIVTSSGNRAIDDDALSKVLDYKIELGESTDVWRNIPVIYMPEK